MKIIANVSLLLSVIQVVVNENNNNPKKNRPKAYIAQNGTPIHAYGGMGGMGGGMGGSNTREKKFGKKKRVSPWDKVMFEGGMGGMGGKRV